MTGARWILLGALAAGVLVAIGLGTSGERPPPSPPYTCPEATGFDPWTLVADVAGIPTHRGHEIRRFSSYDRGAIANTFLGPGNKDFNNFLAVCGPQTRLLLQDHDGVACEDGAQGYLLAKVAGRSGYVSRMWFGALGLAGMRFAGERLVIFTDDLEAPSVDIALADLDAGTVEPFTEPFAGDRSRGTVSYVPIGFKHDLRVYLRRPLSFVEGFYYHVDVHLLDEPVRTFCPALPADSAALRAEIAPKLAALGANPNQGFALARDDAPVALAAGAETMLFDHAGAGTLETLEIALPEGSIASWNALRLRLTWDEDAAPGIDLPLDQLFGLELGAVPYQGLFLGHRVEGAERRLYVYLPMPFRSHARVAIANQGAAEVPARVTVGLDAALPPEPFGELRAVRHETVNPSEETPLHLVADLRGRGVFVGALFTLVGHGSSKVIWSTPLNILEGDPRITIDGDGAHALRGTGSEEIADGAFYFNGGPFASSFALATVVDDAGGTGRAAFQRWNLLGDALDYDVSFRYDAELGIADPRSFERYATVSFYYAVP
ncbi:MAG: DUF2961 domain-containing protein [Myxococcales bacterium]|nr:DUF2961 domain-containing protein [Myxococcales bacterium]